MSKKDFTSYVPFSILVFKGKINEFSISDKVSISSNHEPDLL